MQEIELKLKEKFRDIKFEMIEDLLLRRKKSKTNTNKLEVYLQINKLPNSFVEVINSYNFDNLSIQNIQFGVNSDYIERLIYMNSPEQYWYTEAKNNNLIFIGSGDPFAIFMDIREGVIYGVSSENSFDNKVKIANDFCHFIQGLGTSFLKNEELTQEELIDLLLEEFGNESRDFWNQII